MGFNQLRLITQKWTRSTSWLVTGCWQAVHIMGWERCFSLRQGRHRRWPQGSWYTGSLVAYEENTRLQEAHSGPATLLGCSELVAGLLRALLPLVPSWSCPLVSRAVKEGMEPRVEVRAISRLCDSFCSWDTGPAEQSMSVRPSSLVPFIFLAVGSEVVGESKGLVAEEEAFMPRL